MTMPSPACRRAVASVFLLLACCASASLTAATVSTLDGRVLSGGSLAFDAKAATVGVGTVTVALADCDWIEPGSGAGIALAPKALGIWLVDGSWLPATTLAAAGTDNTLAVSGPLGAFELPLASVLGWSAAAELPGPHGGTQPDADQVQLDSGVVPGRVDGLVGGKLVVRLELDPSKPQAFPLDQVRGLRMALPPRPTKGLSLSLALNDAHPALRLVVGASGSAEEGLRLAAAPAVAMGKAVANGRLRIEGGRRTYLGELNPEQVEEIGAFGVVWPWQRDRNLDGSPLRLGGMRFDHGIAVHSQARLAWKLQGAYVRLHALAGIADLVADQGDCAASLIADGKPLWHRDSVKGGEKPVPIDLDLTGVQQLELRVDYGARYDIGDHFVLADAFMVKAR
jgi:hypothetical protein